MAQFELPIYGAADEQINKYETDVVRWSVFLEALDLSENIEGKTPRQQFEMVAGLVKKIFPSLTDEDLARADIGDVMNTFTQLIQKANKIGGGNSKNAKGAE